MDKFPSEILDNIVGHFHEPADFNPFKLAPHATISREWQKHIERRTFSDLSISSDRLVEFLAIVAGPRRRYLRRLNLQIELRFPGILANNASLTEALRDLFLALSVWDIGENPTFLGLRVEISNTGVPNAFSPFDDSVFEIYTIDNFPCVPLIRKLEFESKAVISDSSWISLTSRLPNLEDLEAVVNDRQKLDLAQRRQNRYKLAVTMSKMNTDNLVHFNLFSRRFGWTRTYRPTSNVLLPDGVDHLNIQLNRVLRSPHLRTFRVRSEMPFSPILFHMPADDTYFPRLEVVELRFGPCAPDGEQYFHGSMENGAAEEVDNYEDNDYDDPEDPTDPDAFEDHSPPRYRYIAASESLRPLLLAAAHALASHRMPCLREFSLKGPRVDANRGDVWNWHWSHTVADYVAPGVPYPLHIVNFPELPEEPDLWKPRSYLRVQGLDEDKEIEKAWSMVRKGALVYWNYQWKLPS